MGHTKLVAVETPNSRGLAELNGIRQDLATVTQLCSRLLEFHSAPGNFDDLVFEALATGAAIRYGRCFLSGVAQRRDLFAKVSPHFSSAQRDLHEFVINYRSKFVAHSVNPYEQNDVLVAVPDPLPESWAPTDLSFHHTRQLGFGQKTIRGLRDLAGWVDARVDEIISREKPTVLNEIRAISLADLASRPVIGPRLATRSDVKRPR